MAGVHRHAGPGVERVLQKLRKSVEDGNYYEAHQMYRTIYFRFKEKLSHSRTSINLIFVIS